MKLAIASDHGGLHLKKAILQYLQSQNIDLIDLGITEEQSVDYPDYAAEVAQRVSTGMVDAGILVCGTGTGMAITANKFKGVRAAVASDPYTARMSKEHNNANILALGGRVLSEEKGLEVLKAWLEAKFEGERHARRVEKITEIEKKNFR